MNRLKNTKKAKAFVILFDGSIIYGTFMKTFREIVEWTYWRMPTRCKLFFFASIFSASTICNYFSLWMKVFFLGSWKEWRRRRKKEMCGC